MAEINSKATDSLPTTINEGKRNLTIFSYGVQLKKEHKSSSTIADLMHQANKTRCNPPMEDDEINHLIRNVLNWDSNKPLGTDRKGNPPQQIPTSLFLLPSRPLSNLRRYSQLMISLLSTLALRKTMRANGFQTANPSL